MLRQKYFLKTLPVTENFLKEKRLIQERGELALIADGQEIRHITYFSLNPGPDYFRGNHYHKKKKETVYVISGKLKVLLKDIENQQSEVIILTSGDKLTIMPLCAHKFFCIEKAQVIEYYQTSFDAEDEFLYNNFM